MIKVLENSWSLHDWSSFLRIIWSTLNEKLWDRQIWNYLINYNYFEYTIIVWLFFHVKIIVFEIIVFEMSNFICMNHAQTEVLCWNWFCRNNKNQQNCCPLCCCCCLLFTVVGCFILNVHCQTSDSYHTIPVNCRKCEQQTCVSGRRRRRSSGEFYFWKTGHTDLIRGTSQKRLRRVQRLCESWLV